MSHNLLAEPAASQNQTPAHVLLPQLSLQSMFWRPKYQEASSWLVHVPVAFWLVEASQPHRLVELGVSDGASWCGFCQAMERHIAFPECTGFTVSEPPVALMQYTEAQYQEFAQLARATQAQALERLAAGSVDLLHVAPGVAQHIEPHWPQWQARLSSRAVVVISQAGVGQPGESLYRQLRNTHPHFLFRQGEGLAVVAVGKQQSETVQRLLAFDESHQAYRLIQQVFARLGLACTSSAQGESEAERQLQQQLAAAEVEKEQLLVAEKERLEEEKEQLVAEKKALATAKEALAQSHLRLEDELTRHLDDMAALAQRLQTAERERDTHREQAADTARRLKAAEEELNQRLQTAERERDTHREQAADTARRLKAAEQQLAQLQQASNEAARERQTFQERHAQLQRDHERLAQQKNDLQQEMAGLQQRLAQATAELEQAKRHHEQERHQLTAQQRALEQEQQARFEELAELTKMLAEKDQQLATLQQPPSGNAFTLRLAQLGKARGLKGKAARQLKEESRLVRASGLFDDAWYLQQYPDVQQSGMPALEHFLRFGGREGRAPGPSFDTQWYLETYHDVAASDLNPLVHYLKFGKAEERRINAWHGN